MQPIEMAAHIRYMTRTNSVSLPDSDILALMKIRQDELAKICLEVDEDILLIPQTTDLVADQRIYAFPSDFLARIKRVEAKLDGTSFIKLFPMDMTEFGYALTESNITTYYANIEGEAFYDIYRKSLYLMSGTITDVTGGLKVWVNTYPAVITDLASTTDMSVDPSTTTHGIPRELHEIWARGVIIDFKESREKPIPLSEREQKYDYDKIKAIQAMRNQDLDREVIGMLPPASDRGDNGANF